QSLPIPTAAPVVVAAPVEEPKKKGSGAPRAAFVGREEELAAFTEMGTGPIAVVGPAGIGKRWPVEKAIQGQKRIPDFHVGWGSEADSLFARLAMHGGEVGDRRLGEALRTPEGRPPPTELVQPALDI